MILPFIFILYFFLIKFTIKKAKQNVNVNKHVVIRFCTLMLLIALGYLILYLMEGRSAALGALFLAAYLTAAWLVYLLAEAISLFVVKQHVLARSNLFIMAITTFFIIIIVVRFA